MSTPSPHVLIVGAGIAGLFLGILLERARIPYTIYERSDTVRPLGSVMSLNVNILPALEQAGLYEELLKFSFMTPGMHIYNEDMSKIQFIQYKGFQEMVGYDYLVFSRPRFYDLLLSKIPPGRIQFNKRVLAIKHLAEGGVSIAFSDNTSQIGDIVVGADGAYSGVRQSMYRSLEDNGLLPQSDGQRLRIRYLTMFGTTDPLDDNEYQDLKDDFSHFRYYIGQGRPHTWSTFTVPEKKICWGIQVQVSTSCADDMAFRNTSWSSEGNELMIKEIRDLPTIYGPVSRFIDATPQDRISHAFMEEKMFETWFHERTVLIGDGQGAVNALQDAVILANCLYEIANKASSENITAAFQSYKDQRYTRVKFQFKSSSFRAKLLFGQTMTSCMLRQLILSYMSKSSMRKDALREAVYRPQCTFLPLTPPRGIHPVLPQMISKRYAEEQERARQSECAVAI
ncbi:hypothetical protein BGZ98_007012 [Dissophora globulifera]|nr:hypothetical protein BGZ98_007012 [Dissophora globulifera]